MGNDYISFSTGFHLQLEDSQAGSRDLPGLEVFAADELTYSCGRPIHPEALSASAVSEYGLERYSTGRPFDYMNPLIG